jgi:hypothetical protein
LAAIVSALLLLLFLVLCLPPRVRAEPSDLRLSVQRLRGADLLGHVAGTFRLSVQTAEDVQKVTFYVDGQPVAHVTDYPYVFQFDTWDFGKGLHHLQAVAHCADGSVATSNGIALEFRSRNWLIAVRQSTFLYAAVVVLLGIVGGVVVHRLLRLQPRLMLLDP